MRRNKPKRDSGPDNTWLTYAGANLLLLIAFLLFFLFVVAVVAYSMPAQALEWPKFDEPKNPTAIYPEEKPPQREKAPPPPDIKPYRVPTLNGEQRDFHHVPPIKLSKQIDADAVFRMVVNCFPERPKWGLEIKAVAGARYTEQNTVSTFDTAGLSRYYAGIVAEMPLYSAEELQRQRAYEYQRRQEAATHVAALLKALADRDRALRLVGIEESAELRSQVRVSEGIAPAEEQLGYLREVANRTSELVAANAAITAARLALAGQCRDEVAEQVNNYLVEVTQ